MGMRWVQALGAGVVLGLAALATNLPLDTWGARGESALTALLTASKVVNSGTAWAGLGVLAGWLVSRGRAAPSSRRTFDAALAAILASELALVVHYAVGQAIGHFDASIWWANKSWFMAAIVMGALMGVVGATTRRNDLLGLVARLVVPAGAVVEPVLRGFFGTARAASSAAHVAATTTGGAILVVSGLAGAVLVAVTTRQQRRAPASSPVVGATHYTRGHG